MKNNFFDPKSLAMDADSDGDGDFTQGDPLPAFIDPLNSIESPPLPAIPSAEPTIELLAEVKEAVQEWVTPMHSLPVEDTHRFTLAQNLFQLVNSNFSFQQLSQEVLKELQIAIGATQASLLEINHSKQELFFRACIGADILQISSVCLPLNQGVVGKVINSRAIENIAGIETTKNDSSLQTMVSILANVEIKNAMAAPIIIDNEIFAVVEFFNKQSLQLGEQEGFSEYDKETLRIGSQMAAKIFEIRFLLAKLAQNGK